MEETTKIILSGVREAYARLVWTHKVHEKCADRYKACDDRFKIAQIILSVLLAAGGISSITEYLPDAWKMWVAILVAVLSFILAMVNAFLKNRNYAQLVVLHSETAAKLWYCRECMLAVLVDGMAGKLSDADIATKRDAILCELAQIYEKAPRTSPEDYDNAGKAIKENEEMTFTAEEIDLMLPVEIRWGSTKTEK